MLSRGTGIADKHMHTCKGIIVTGAHELQQCIDDATAGLHGQLSYCWIRCQSGQSGCQAMRNLAQRYMPVPAATCTTRSARFLMLLLHTPCFTALKASCIMSGLVAKTLCKQLHRVSLNVQD